MHTFVIAEAASCHDGKLDKALQLVEMAKQIGADAVKYQWTSSPKRIVERRHAPEYLQAYQTIAHPIEWHGILQQACERAGIEYMTTVYLPEDIEVIAPYVKRFKVASFEAKDETFIAAHYRFHKEMIVSTGMQEEEKRGNHQYWTFDDDDSGNPKRVSFLHCVSAYPTPISQINLGAISGGFYDGLSDHTTHPLTGALAVAAGASIIEFHLRLNLTDPSNPDFLVSRFPTQAHEYIQNIRLAEIMMGDGVKRIMDCEKPMVKYRVGV